MIPASSPAEALFQIERQLQDRAARCLRLRYYPYPCADRRLVLVTAELDDNTDVQVLCRLDWPINVDGDSYDEIAIERQFAMPSGAKH